MSLDTVIYSDVTWTKKSGSSHVSGWLLWPIKGEFSPLVCIERFLKWHLKFQIVDVTLSSWRFCVFLFPCKFWNMLLVRDTWLSLWHIFSLGTLDCFVRFWYRNYVSSLPERILMVVAYVSYCLKFVIYANMLDSYMVFWDWKILILCCSYITAGHIVSHKTQPQIPKSCDLERKSQIESCWSAAPSDILNFTEIANQLRAMAKK